MLYSHDINAKPLRSRIEGNKFANQSLNMRLDDDSLDIQKDEQLLQSTNLVENIGGKY